MLDRAAFRLTIISGLLFAPTCLAMALAEGTCWRPTRLLPQHLDLSDLLCCYATGAMVWFSLAVFRREEFTPQTQGRVFLVRYNAVILLAGGLVGLALWAGLDGMSAILAACAVVAGVLGLRLRGMSRFALSASARFALVYLLTVKFYFACGQILWASGRARDPGAILWWECLSERSCGP